MATREFGAYVTRAKTPNRVLTTPAMTNAIKRFLPTLESAAEEAIEMQRTLQEAEIAEQDQGKRSRLEEAFQKLGAIRRITGDLTLYTRQLVQAFRELDEVNARITTESAEPKPITVKGRAASPKPKAVKPKVVKSRPER
jgi:hypothetical protein